MAEQTTIAWTHRTFNPWMGCMKVSPGCAHCYAEELVTRRFKKPLWGPAATTNRQRTSPANWKQPLRWNAEVAAGRSKRHLVFCASLADVFEDHPALAPWRAELFELMRSTPSLIWQVLTKRPENIARMLPADWGGGYFNVWLGTSIEDEWVTHRADHLREIPAAVRFISYEPALGPLDELDLTGIDWLIYGGESGPHFRLDDDDWLAKAILKCADTGTAFFLKQRAARRPGSITDFGLALRRFPANYQMQERR